MEKHSVSTPNVTSAKASLPKLINIQNKLNDEVKEIRDFGNDIDVMYLDRLKAIHEKIKSCISCSEYECPFIKERMKRHLTKQHSFADDRFRSRNDSSVFKNSKKDDIAIKNHYSKRVRSEIMEWSKDIPVYPNQIFEFKKQNLLNLLIENIIDMIKNIKDDDYNFKLDNVVNSFLNSLPGLGKEELNETLKENLLGRMYNINDLMYSNAKKDKSVTTDTKYIKEEGPVENNFEDKPQKPEVKEVATSTLINDLLNSKQNISTNTVIEYYNEVIGPEIFLKRTNTSHVQVSASLVNTVICQNSTCEFDNTKVAFKEKVFEWMKALIDKGYEFVNSNVDREFIANIMWDELKGFVSKSSKEDKFTLKRKILRMLDQMPLNTAVVESCYKFEIANDLYNRLLDCKDDSKNTSSTKMKIQKLVEDALETLDLTVDNNAFNEISNIFFKNLFETDRKLIKEDIFLALKTLTKLQTGDIFNLINTIMDAMKRITLNKSDIRTNNFGCSPFSGTLTVFTSEHEMNSTQHTKTSVQGGLKLSSYEITYVNKIVEAINLWLDTLPKEFKSADKRDDNVKYLAREIYDQIKLEETGDEDAVESEKFKMFIIRKWLNRFDFFDSLSEAKPYVEGLVRDINEIPKIYLSEQKGRKIVICCGSKLEPENTMKNLISKYIEYNETEDNSDTRGVFANLLKSELPNLSLPSRKEVYDSLERNMYEAPSFKKLDKELLNIMVITECIQDIPLSDSFTNKKRNELISKLSEDIYNVDENLTNNNIEDLVKNFASELPISTLPDYRENFDIIVDEILEKLRDNPLSNTCCCFTETDQVNLSINTNSLGDYIECFIQDNYEILIENELVLEACSFRLLKEVNNLIAEDSTAFNTTEVYKRFDDSLSGQSERRFSAELKYAKEISDWLRNLPLLPVLNEEDSTARTKKLTELIHKMQEYNDRKNKESNSNVDTNFTAYLERWLISFPLDSRREIKVPLVIKQLLNRMERINKNQKQKKKANIVCRAPVPCCSHGKNENKSDPARVIVESVEKWCRDLPIDGETEDVNILKDTIATKLYQKLGDLNNSSMYFNDETYRDSLGQEIDSLLDTVSPNDNLTKKRVFLKNKLLQIIMDNKKLLKQKLFGREYKQRLENKIAMSLSNPVNKLQQEDPDFEIYKDLLATMFILDNFDYSNSAVKLKYENKIREQIDKHHQSALKRNPVWMEKEHMFVDLYSVLFQVPVPNQDSITDEVEEIKTRCEIEIWFEKLPLTDAKNANESLQRHRIISMLAKRLHQIENEANPDDKMHKEIIKWLKKLPLLPGYDTYVDQYASELQRTLKSTFAMRKCISQVNISKLIEKVNSRTFIPHHESQTQTPLPTCCQIRQLEAKKPADRIIEIVESWCKDLDIPANTPKEKDDAKAFKDNMVIKIIMKISQLNMNTEIFNDDNNYKAALDDELDNVFEGLPSCCRIVQNKEQEKKKLIEAIISVKPMIIEENSRYKYKHDLKNVANSVLDIQSDTKSEIVSEIVDNFIFYHYYKEDISGKQTYKILITEAVDKCLSSCCMNGSKDPLLTSNHLVSELSKVPSPGDKVLVDEVEEIRMKSEVNEFLNELPGSNEPIKSQIKASLARRLSDLEKSGHSNEIEAKMKDEIKRCLRKINESIDALEIDEFIEKLRDTEPERKSHPPSYSNTNDTFTTLPVANRNVSYINQEKSDDSQWISLLPASNDNQKMCSITKCPKRSDQKNKRPNYGLGNNPNRRFSNVSYPQHKSEHSYEVESEFETGLRITSTPNEDKNCEVFEKSRRCSYHRPSLIKTPQNGNQIRKIDRKRNNNAVGELRVTGLNGMTDESEKDYTRYQIASERIPSSCQCQKPCIAAHNESCMKKILCESEKSRM